MTRDGLAAGGLLSHGVNVEDAAIPGRGTRLIFLLSFLVRLFPAAIGSALQCMGRPVSKIVTRR